MSKSSQAFFESYYDVERDIECIERNNEWLRKQDWINPTENGGIPIPIFTQEEMMK